MKRKIVGLLVLIISVTTNFAGCAGSSDSASTSTYDVASEGSTYDGGGFDADIGSFYADTGSAKSAMPNESASEYSESEAPAEYRESEETSGEIEYDTSRKIVYNSSIDIETKNFDEDVKAIKQLVASNGGYYESSSISGTAEYGGRNAYYTARVPSKNYQSFMESVGGIGSVTYSSENVDDITSNYVDVQARLKSLNRKLQRLEELEANAETVQDLLSIEDRINNVQYDIENYTAQLRLYDDKVDYCTVSISLDEVVTYSEVKKDTAWNRFTEAFVSSFSGFIAFLQWIVIALIYILPYALVAAVIFVIVLVATKKTLAARKAKKEKEAETIKNQSKQAKGEYSGPVYSTEEEQDKK